MTHQCLESKSVYSQNNSEVSEERSRTQLKSDCPIAELYTQPGSQSPVSWIESDRDTRGDRNCDECPLKRSIDLFARGVDVSTLIAPISIHCFEEGER